MAKDKLDDALHGLKVIEKRRTATRQPKRIRPKRGRPKAFDPFYLFCIILAALGVALQFLAITVYS